MVTTKQSGSLCIRSFADPRRGRSSSIAQRALLMLTAALCLPAPALMAQVGCLDCGKFGNALVYGPDAHVTIQDDPTLALQAPFTIEAWIFYEGPLGTGQSDEILRKDNEYVLAIADTGLSGISTGHLIFAFGSNPPGCSAAGGWCDAGGPVPTGAWTHVALVATTDNTKTYINGQLQMTYGGLSTLDPFFHPLLIGGTDVRSFNGRIDEVRLSSVARDPADFCFSTPCAPDPDTIGLWHFDEADGMVAFDSSANALDGQLNGAAWACCAGPWQDLDHGLPGFFGIPVLSGLGCLLPGAPVGIQLSNARPLSTAWLVIGLVNLSAPFKCGTLVPSPDLLAVLGTGPGTVCLGGEWPSGVPSGVAFYLQFWVLDSVAVCGYAASNALSFVTP